MSRKLSRNEKIGVWALVVAAISLVIGGAISIFLPEIRRALSLEKPASALVTTAAPHADVPPATIPAPQSSPPLKTPLKPTHLSKKKPVKPTPSPVTNPPIPAVHVNNAPNSIIIDGGTAINPTVNNYGPPPPPTPTVTICALPSVPNGQKYTTTLTLKTDGKIVQPFYALFFDAPVLPGSASMDGHTFGVTQGRADKLPNPERSYLFRVTSIDFGTNVWTPGEEIKVTVPSDQPIKLINLLYGAGDDPFEEYLIYSCD